MKSILMKVNYDPRYVKPHRKTWHHPTLLNHPASLHHSTSLNHQPDAYATLSSRLSTMRDIYGPPSDQSLQRSLEVAARRQLKHHSRQVSDMATTEANSVGHLGKKRTEFTRKSYSSPLLEPLNSTDKRLNPEAPHRSKTSFQSFSDFRNTSTGSHDRGPSSDKVSHAYSSQILGPSRPQLSNSNVLYGKIRDPQNKQSGNPQLNSSTHNTGEKYIMELKRSRTMGVVDGRKKEEKLSEKNAELRKMIRRAKREAEKAIKNRKIFTIIGPYHALRVALRQRGWVEKLNNSPALGPVPVVVKKWQTENDKETDCLSETIEDLPMKNERFWWEEDGGFYGMMSQIVRNHQATFIFTVKTVDCRILQIAQTVNHFSKNRHITTKSGLCQNLRNTSWFDAIDHHAFYPRCYRLDDVDECSSFIEDHRITTCVGFIKCFMEQHQYKSSKHHGSLPKIVSGDPPDSPREDPGRPRSHSLSESLPVVPGSESARSARSGSISSPREQVTPSPKDNSCTCTPQDSPRSQRSDQSTSVVKPAITLPQANDSEDRVIVPVSALEMAMRHCERFLKVKSHQDIDHGTTVSKSELEDEERWDTFVNSYYDFVHKNGKLNKVSEEMVKDCKQLLVKLKERLLQFEMDGMRNIWIIKPGAKSRGRGIQCMDHLPNILKSCSDADGSMVVQKYIERPFLIYNTKFDIRQWFLVTSWKPLTIWFYKDCYLRFCSQEFTLDDYNAAIHLSNNSIQKHYKNSRRSSRLPADNTWTSDEFRRYLVERKRGVTWDLKIIPAMKKSILCSLLCSQEFIDNRKNAYELYGADFMLTEDLRPWLLEINSSPSMARTTHATNVLVDNVLEDLIKVVLDRKEDKNCDIGRFELIYRQATIVDPNPGDLSFMVLGRRMKKLRGKLHCLSSNPESSTARDGTSAKEGQAPTPHNWEPGLMKRAENSFF